MARPPRSTIFEITETQIRAGWGGRTATIACHEEDDNLIVIEMDSLERWDGGEEISLPDLQRLFDLVERECEARGIEAEFE